LREDEEAVAEALARTDMTEPADRPGDDQVTWSSGVLHLTRYGGDPSA
jgi:hypothetical protein